MIDTIFSSPASHRQVTPRHFALGAFAVHPEQPEAPLAVSGGMAAFDVAMTIEGLPHVGASLATTIHVVVNLARTEFVENHESPLAPVVASVFPPELDAAMAHLTLDERDDVRDTIHEMVGVAAGRWLLASG